MSAGMSSMNFKMQELLQGRNPDDKIIDATSEALDGPDWASNLEICDLMNGDKVNSVDLIRAIKRRIMLNNSRIQYLALVLLETCVKNCEKAFSEVAAERVLDEMVKLIDDPQTVVNNRNKALILIETWGEPGNELHYLPVYEETYKSLKSRGIRFPDPDDESLAPVFTPARSVSEQIKEALNVARNSIEILSTVLSSSPEQEALQDDLATTLVQQCHESQFTIQRIVETSSGDESVTLEALDVNDQIQKVLAKYEEMKRPPLVQSEPEPAMIPVAVEPDESPQDGKDEALTRKPAKSQVKSGEDDMLQDLDEMIFGKKGAGASSEGGQDKKKEQKDDLISF